MRRLGGCVWAMPLPAAAYGLTRALDTCKTSPTTIRGGCWFQDGGLSIHLGVEADFRAAKKAHPALRVVGLAELVQRLRANGLDVRDDEMLPGHERVYVDDPFGNRIELLEPIT